MMNMALLFSHEHLVTMFGLLGNIVAFFVYLSPLPTFIKIYKKKSTQDFAAIPYSVALFSSMLTMYYGLNKHEHGIYLITINSFGILVESIYLGFYFFYASRKIRIHTTKLIVLFNLVLLGAIILFTSLFTSGLLREKVVGWFCAVFAVCVFASPLSVMRQVIKTKSVESLPAGLCLFLTLSALIWFIYGFISHDFFIAVPNVLGLALGFVQMTLYLIYRGNSSNKTVIVPKEDSVIHTDLQLHVIVDPTISINKSSSPDLNNKEDKQNSKDFEYVTDMAAVVNNHQVVDIILPTNRTEIPDDTQKISSQKEDDDDDDDGIKIVQTCGATAANSQGSIITPPQPLLECKV